MSSEERDDSLQDVNASEMSEVLRIASELYVQDQARSAQAEERRQLARAAQEAGVPEDYLRRAAASVIARRALRQRGQRQVGALAALIVVLGLGGLWFSRQARRPVAVSPTGPARAARLSPTGVPGSARQAFEVSLARHVTYRLDEPMLGSAGNDLAGLAGSRRTGDPARRTLLGVPFRLDGVVLVGPTDVSHPQTGETVTVPRSVRNIPIGLKAARLHFLHGTNYQSVRGARIGAYIVHYSDGTQVSIPIRYGIDLVDWWAYPGAEPAEAPVAWTGTNRAATQFGAAQGRTVRLQLFLKTWNNPTPQREIRRLDMVSRDLLPGETPILPFLVGLTAER